MALELELLNNGGNAGELAHMSNGNPGPAGLNITSQKFKVRVFLNMDEDDDGKLGMPPSDLFVRVDETLPFFIDVSSKHWEVEGEKKGFQSEGDFYFFHQNSSTKNDAHAHNS